MKDEVLELKEEIEILNKRIGILEKKENRRRAFTYIKVLVKVLLIGAIAFGIWKGYEYVVHEVPNMMEEKIKELNPFKGIKLGDSNE